MRCSSDSLVLILGGLHAVGAAVGACLVVGVTNADDDDAEDDAAVKDAKTATIVTTTEVVLQGINVLMM